MKVIEGQFRVVSDAEPRALKHPAYRLAQSIPKPVRWLLCQPIFWVWVVMLSFVVLTEGWS